MFLLVNIVGASFMLVLITACPEGLNVTTTPTTNGSDSGSGSGGGSGSGSTGDSGRFFSDSTNFAGLSEITLNGDVGAATGAGNGASAAGLTLDGEAMANGGANSSTQYLSITEVSKC